MILLLIAKIYENGEKVYFFQVQNISEIDS